MKHEGYLLIDHRASPGLSAADKLAAGLPQDIDVGEGKIFEAATKTCKHCGTPVILRPERVRPRGHCRKCNGYVCDSPACNDPSYHIPFAGLLDEAAKRIPVMEARGQAFNLSIETLRRSMAADI